MNRRKKHPPIPEAPPQSIRRPRPALSVEEVLSHLDGVPTVDAEARERVRAYLTEKSTQYPGWWSAQPLYHLLNLSQVFGVRHGLS